MKKINATEEKETAGLVNFVPATVRRRKVLLEGIVTELKTRGFRKLDASSPEDLDKVVDIIAQLHPESAPRTVRNYAVTAIWLFNKGE